MTRIVFAWELGGNLGHILRNLRLARCLRDQGHDVWFAVCDVSIAHALLTAHDFPFVACPTLPRPAHRLRAQPFNYSQLLIEQGYEQKESLHSSASAWVSLLRALKPGVIVADFAPTALISARILSIPALSVGPSFSIPPQVDPLPSIRLHEHGTVEALRHLDQRALNAINEVLEAHRRPPLNRMADLFAGPPPLVTTFAELDYYSPRQNVRYLGPVTHEEAHPAAQWDAGSDKKRVFVYLRPSVPGFEPVLAALRTLPVQLICVLVGAPDSMIERLRRERMPARNTPVQFASLLPECDLVVNYGSAGTVAQALVAGVPLLLLPDILERQLNAACATKLGAVIDMGSSRTVERCTGAIEELLFTPGYRERAQMFRRKYEAFDNEEAAMEGARAIVMAAGEK